MHKYASGKKTVTKAVILECSCLGLAGDLVRTVVGESISDFLLNLTDVDARIDDEWYYSLLRDRLYNDDGEVISWWYSEQEKLMFERDPHGHLMLYGNQVSGYLESIAADNEDTINMIYSSMSMEEITVSSIALKDKLILLVRGKQP
jgi:hypothetical protein